jgi:hypothetical protein
MQAEAAATKDCRRVDTILQRSALNICCYEPLRYTIMRPDEAEAGAEAARVRGSEGQKQRGAEAGSLWERRVCVGEEGVCGRGGSVWETPQPSTRPQYYVLRPHSSMW